MKKIDFSSATLGIEFGSSKIKAVLIGADHVPLASGSCDWKSAYVNGVWTYSLDQVWEGLRTCYRDLAAEVRQKYGVELQTVGCMGISAMMHGYLPFDAEDRLLTPFRTWQNTITAPAAAELSELFRFNIPQRWSIAHLDQAMLNGEAHVKDVAFFTTLAGYVHWQLTGEKVLGVGDASGMFPIDSTTGSYDEAMMDKFNALAVSRGYPRNLRDLLPRVLQAGESAGVLTEAGARLLDPPAPCTPAFLCAPPRATQVPAWWPPTLWLPGPGMSLPEHPSFLWWCWSTPFPATTRRSTWLPLLRESLWPWSTATTAPTT